MAESLVQVTEGSGKKLHTFQRTIGANNVEDEIVIQGLPYLASYIFEVNAASVATANAHILQIMAGASLNVYLVRAQLWQDAAATTAAWCGWSIRRLTTAGTGGTARTGNPHDLTDAAAGATGIQIPGVKGTEGVALHRTASYMTQTPGAAGVMMQPVLDFNADANGLYKPLRISAGVANGLAIKNETAIAAATVSGYAIVIEANF